MSPEELDALLVDAEQDASRMVEVLRALKNSDLLVPVAEDAPGKVDALVLDGVPHVVVFTSTAQMDRAGRHGSYATAPSVEFAASLPPSVGIALNPGGVGFPLHPTGVRALASGMVTFPAGTRVRLGDPAEEPSGLLTAVAAQLRTTSVIEARRVWAQVGDDVPGLVIGVSAPDRSLRPDVVEAVRRATAQADPGFPVDVVSLDDGSPFSAWMQANTSPFYPAP